MGTEETGIKKILLGFKNGITSLNTAEKLIQERSYSEEELFKIINDFCFDWNYNYKGELSQKEYLIEWFEKFKKK
jgi:hypothetical protein